MSVLDRIVDPLDVFGPTDRAKRAYAETRARWAALAAWGVEAKVPEDHDLLDHWRSFSSRWEASPGLGVGQDAEGLQGIGYELATAERNAAAHGYVPPVVHVADNGDVTETPGKPIDPIVPRASAGAPHPTEATKINAAASTVERAAEGPTDDPYFTAKAAVVGAMALGTVAGTIAASGEARRIGVAALGAVATAGAAILLFSSSKSAPKKP